MNGHVRTRHKRTCRTVQNKKARCNCAPAYQARFRNAADPVKWTEKTFRLKRDADDWLQSQQGSQLRGDWIDPRQSDRPFSDVIEAWQESWSNRLSPTTAGRYSGIVALYLNPEFGNVAIGRITHEVVQRYVNRLSNQKEPKLSPATVRAIYSVLRNVMGKGVRLGIVRTNPCTKIELPRSPREEMLFLTAQEVRTLAEGIDKHYRVLIYTAAYCGLRAGELLALQRQDVDLLRGVMTVRRSQREVAGHLSLGDTKTYTARTVSLPAFLKTMLTEHLSSGLLGGNGPEALVFPSKRGGAIRHNNFYKRHWIPTVRGWTDKEGEYHPGVFPERLHPLRFHDLRHTCASLSIAAGAHVKQVSVRLGHSSVQITLDRYTHLFPSAEAAVAERLDAIFHAEPEVATTNVAQLRG